MRRTSPGCRRATGVGPRHLHGCYVVLASPLYTAVVGYREQSIARARQQHFFWHHITAKATAIRTVVATAFAISVNTSLSPTAVARRRKCPPRDPMYRTNMVKKNPPSLCATLVIQHDCKARGVGSHSQTILLHTTSAHHDARTCGSGRGKEA